MKSKFEEFEAEVNEKLEALDSLDVSPSGEISIDMLSAELVEMISDSGDTITNNPDGEDLTTYDTPTGEVIRFADREYISNLQMGSIVLRTNILDNVNILSQDMISAENTMFEVRYDYDLDGETITIPYGSILNFVGGSLKNGTLNGVNTGIQAGAYQIFQSSLNLSGMFTSAFKAEWFGGQIHISESEDHSDFDCASAMNHAIKQVSALDSGGLILLSGIYLIKSPIYLRPKVSIEGLYRNSFYLGNNPKKLGCGFLADFSNKSQWILDTVLIIDGEDIYTDDHKDLSPYTTTSQECRKASVSLRNFDILAVLDDYYHPEITNFIFGGLRMSYMYNATIENMNIAGTIYGMALSHSWVNTVNNLWIISAYCGIYLGPNATDTLISRVYINPTKNFEYSDLPTLATMVYTTTLPPYCSEVKSVGLIAEGSSTDFVSAHLIGVAIQNTEALMFSTRANIRVDHIYLEPASGEKFTTLFWTEDGKYQITKHKISEFYYTTNYSFGTNSGLIDSDNFGISTCYPGTYSNSDGNVSYIIRNTSNYLFYYDTYEVDSDGVTILSKSRTVGKKIVDPNADTYFIGNSSNFSSNIYETQVLNAGTTLFQKTTFKEFAERAEVPQKVNVCFLYTNVAIEDHESISNKEITFFAYSGNGSYATYLIYASNPLSFKDSTVNFNCNMASNVSSLSSFFNVNGDCSFNFNAQTSAFYSGGTKLFTLCGDKAINIVVRCNITVGGTIKTYFSDIANFVSNYDSFEYPYNIQVILTETGAEYNYTNSSRPTLGLSPGLQHFDTTLSKPIWWSGSTWIDSSGAAV